MNTICIPEESVGVAKPQRDHSIVVYSALAQKESAARTAPEHDLSRMAREIPVLRGWDKHSV
jgi:hypothetical protein